MRLRELGPGDEQARHDLSRLAFGGDPNGVLRDPPPGDAFGAFDDAGRLVAQVVALPYEQYWGGRPVPMAGVAGVAVHPGARSQGLVRQLMGALVGRARERGQLVSALYPTAPRIYRRLDWEVVGSLDTTRLPLQALGVPVTHGWRTRTAGPDDVTAVAQVYDAVAADGSGMLARTGPSFPAGAAGVLEHDVVTLAEDPDGQVVGYASYGRGLGYRGGAALRMGELLSLQGEGALALLRSLASWDSVVDAVLWRGPTDDLALRLPGRVPPPESVQPWMLRVLDPAAAVAARGFPSGLALGASFALAGDDGRLSGWHLEVADGRGVLDAAPADGLPVLSTRGLALLYAGVGNQGRLLREGLLDRPAPELSLAFSGPPPVLLDYF